MQALIASDLHGSASALQFIQAQAEKRKPDLIVFLGDYVYHGPRNRLPDSYDTINILENIGKLPSKIVAVRGNCDAEVDLDLLPFKVAGEAWLDFDGLQIFASHGHRLPLKPPIPGFAPGIIFLCGHSHIPRGESLQGFHFWNPGSVSLPRGGFPPSFGWFEKQTFSVFDFNENLILKHQPVLTEN